MKDATLATVEKNRKYSAAQVIEAIDETKGLLVYTAKKLGCDRATVYRYIQQYPTVAAAVKEARESVTDMAELALYKAIQEGEGWAVCFYLKTQGKQRGYVERTEIDARITNYVVDIDASSDANIIDADLTP